MASLATRYKNLLLTAPVFFIGLKTGMVAALSGVPANGCSLLGILLVLAVGVVWDVLTFVSFGAAANLTVEGTAMGSGLGLVVDLEPSCRLFY